jgi:hypothetical protein
LTDARDQLDQIVQALLGAETVDQDALTGILGPRAEIEDKAHREGPAEEEQV